MKEVEINIIYVVIVAYLILKILVSIWISKREFQYPIWDKKGVQISRKIHHKLRVWSRNFLINPEWGILKQIVYVPVFLFTGKRFAYAFKPWKIQKIPYACLNCKDKGKYFEKPFVMGAKGIWKICECQKNVSCMTYPDTCTFGPNLQSHSFDSTEQISIANNEQFINTNLEGLNPADLVVGDEILYECTEFFQKSEDETRRKRITVKAINWPFVIVDYDNAKNKIVNLNNKRILSVNRYDHRPISFGVAIKLLDPKHLKIGDKFIILWKGKYLYLKNCVGQ